MAADLRKRSSGELLDDVHRHLAREGNCTRVATNFQVLLAQIEVLADALLDQVDGDALFLGSDDVPQHLLRGPQRNRCARQRRVGHQPRQRAFELAHVGLDGARNVFRHVVGQTEALVLGLFLQNRDPGLEVRRLDVRNQSPLKPRTQTFFDGIDVFRQAVRGNHNLLLLLVERVEGVKKFFLGALFSSDELDIVDEQDIHGVETVAETDHAVKAQRIDHFNREFLRADVTQPHRWITLLDGVTDGVHQVRLAHAHSAVKEQRVVRFRRLLSHRARSGMRKLVGLANHKRIEGVARVELVVAALKIQL